jgi:hypothetical protein
LSIAQAAVPVSDAAPLEVWVHLDLGQNSQEKAYLGVSHDETRNGVREEKFYAREAMWFSDAQDQVTSSSAEVCCIDETTSKNKNEER